MRAQTSVGFVCGVVGALAAALVSSPSAGAWAQQDPCVRPGGEVFLDEGFEVEADDLASGDFQVRLDYPRPYAGKGYAFLANADGQAANELEGTLAVPFQLLAPAWVTGSFRYSITTQEPDTNRVGDRIRILLWDQTARVIHEVGELNSGDSTERYQIHEFGFRVTQASKWRLHLEAQTDERFPTLFRVDQLRLVAHPPGCAEQTPSSGGVERATSGRD